MIADSSDYTIPVCFFPQKRRPAETKRLAYEALALSEPMATAFAEYVNATAFKDEDGNILTLEASEEGVYQAGSYYDYIKGVVETSLNNFLSHTTPR